MSNAANTVAIRNSYKALMTACLKNHSDKPADFNRKVEALMHELADGEPYEMTAAFYLRAAQEVAYYQYRVNFRTVAGC
jgi:hypothetical protein